MPKGTLTPPDTWARPTRDLHMFTCWDQSLSQTCQGAAEQEVRVRIPASSLEFQRLVISCFKVAIWLKNHYSDVNPQYNKPNNPNVSYEIRTSLGTFSISPFIVLNTLLNMRFCHCKSNAFYIIVNNLFWVKQRRNSFDIHLLHP